MPRPSLRMLLGGLARRADVESKLDAQAQELRRIRKRIAQLQLSVDALVRHAYVDVDALPFPERLVAQRFRGLSQNGEDGVVLAVFREAGVANARFVEIGCGTNGGNSGFLARELGWSGLMLDASADAVERSRARFRPDRVQVVQATVTMDNVNRLLAEHGIGGEIDLLSIDVDGNDYWILDAIDVCSPRLLVCEYNAWFGPERKVAVPYDEARVREDGSTYFGASLAAFAALAGRRGYRLVAVEPRGANAFFLRRDVAEHVPGWDARDLYMPLVGVDTLTERALSDRKLAEIQDPEARAERELARRGLELVEVE